MGSCNEKAKRATARGQRINGAPNYLHVIGRPDRVLNQKNKNKKQISFNCGLFSLANLKQGTKYLVKKKKNKTLKRIGKKREK